MRALFLDGGRLSYREDLPAPSPASGETRVRVLRAGICATDLALQRGYMGFRGIPGHEFVGEALDGPLAGRRVVGEINAACGTCPTCLAGRPRHCPHRDVLGILARPGAFAEELCLPHANLHAVPDGVSTEAATFAEPLAAAFEIAEQVEIDALENALVLGDGRLGLLCAQVLARAGLRVTVGGRHPERAALLPAGVELRTDLGAQSDVAGAARDAPRWDLVVEATGRPEVLQLALARVRPRGTVVLKTTSEAAAPLDLAPLVVDEITLVGSRCGPFEPALRALADGSVRVERMIAERYPLERGPEAFERAGTPGVLKVLFEVAERAAP